MGKSRKRCADVDTAVFFGPTPSSELRDGICGKCPVRAACLTEVMTAELSAGSKRRHGFAAGLTARQRTALAELGTWQCPECGTAFDPLGFVEGCLECGQCGALYKCMTGGFARSDQANLWFQAIHIGTTMRLAWYHRMDQGETDAIA